MNFITKWLSPFYWKMPDLKKNKLPVAGFVIFSFFLFLNCFAAGVTSHMECYFAPYIINEKSGLFISGDILISGHDNSREMECFNSNKGGLYE